MKDTIFNGFYEKLNVKTRPGRGGNYPYVTADDVTDRMNKLFKGNWSTMVTSQDVIGENVIVRLRVEVTDPDTGSTYFHEGYGGQKEDPSAEAGNVFKSAYSKALVSACRRWGVGLFLTEEDEPTQSTTLTTAVGPVTVPPTTVPTPPTPPPPRSPSGAGAPSVPPTGIPVPPPVTAEIKVEQEPLASMPKIPVPIPSAGIPSQASEEPISSPGVLATDATIEEGMVNDVQKISIESLIKMRGVPYNDMAQAALGRVPDVHTLTHAEAVSVIKHGNDLYKKNKQK